MSEELLQKQCEEWLTKHEVELAINGRHYLFQVDGLMEFVKQQRAEVWDKLDDKLNDEFTMHFNNINTQARLAIERMQQWLDEQKAKELKA